MPLHVRAEPSTAPRCTYYDIWHNTTKRWPWVDHAL